MTIAISHDEAILFRLLTAFFGPDRVVHGMSLMAVCGGELPSAAREHSSFAKRAVCLFTIVDHNDNPRLVVDLFPQREGVIDVDGLDLHQRLRPALKAADVSYISISERDLKDMINPQSSLDLVSYLRGKFESADGDNA